MAARTLTFLFTDIEGSTALLARLGDRYADVLAGHHRLIRASLAAHDGEEVDTQGDAFFAVFPSASAAAAAVIEMQRGFLAHPGPAGETLRVRMGLHSGEASESPTGLVGLAVHRAARVAAAGHGGQILVSAATAALLGDSMPAGVSLRDLGVHRLKDLGRPGRIFQLAADGLPAAFPPLRSLDNPELRNNLPAQVSAFIGRDGELSRVTGLIASSRLVTLTGAGGAGKTRLALQVAAGLLDGSGDGVWFAGLAPLQDPDLVPVLVSNVLGIRDEPGRPVTDTLADVIGRRHLLLVLDNCEHVIDACAKLADALLRNCPHIVLLATSREPLGIAGECVHRVPSLDTPGEHDAVGVIEATEAVRLFTERAAQHGVALAWDERTARVAGRICRRLDGIPLALELAAARLRVMSLADLDARLDQRFSVLTGGSRAALPRQQTLLATVGWSWDLLNPAERHMLARLSVFAGGFDLPAAEAVAAGGEVPADGAVGCLAALVDKSLVQLGETSAGPARYRLLETMRQYSARQLGEAGPAAASATRAAHRDYYLALAETAAPQLIAADQAEWLDRIEAELDNLRAAIAFSLAQPDPEPGIRLVTALRVFWKARGHAAEGADALDAFLAAPAVQAATLLRARALAAAAYLHDQTGSYAVAENCCQEGLTIARAAGDAFLQADLLYVRAYVLLRRGEQRAALALIEAGLSLAHPLGEPHLTASLLAARAFAVDVAGDHAAAARDATESVRLYRQAGDRLQVGTMAGNLGYVQLSLGDLASARQSLLESLGIARELDDQYGVVYETFNLGLAEYLSGSLAAAAALFAESLGLATRMHMPASTAYALHGLAMADSGGAQTTRPAQLHGAADRALAALGETLEPLEGRLRDASCQRLRSAMGAGAFQAAYDAGQALASDEVLALASGQDGS